MNELYTDVILRRRPDEESMRWAMRLAARRRRPVRVEISGADPVYQRSAWRRVRQLVSYIGRAEGVRAYTTSARGENNTLVIACGWKGK